MALIGPKYGIMILNMVFGRLQKAGVWAWDALCCCSFFSKLLGGGAVIFQVSGFDCSSIVACLIPDCGESSQHHGSALLAVWGMPYITAHMPTPELSEVQNVITWMLMGTMTTYSWAYNRLIVSLSRLIQVTPVRSGAISPAESICRFSPAPTTLRSQNASIEDCTSNQTNILPYH